MSERSYYEILGVSKTANDDEIKKASDIFEEVKYE
jgi:DnaJ-class molecular chaperone